jgi:bifunctional DNA-binding transcriptional regulator/antitoxin component of YhaV-PrlF toxin-antitoxin module
MLSLEYMKQFKIIAEMMGRGKITIPQEVRDVLKLKDGDYVGAIVWKIELPDAEEAET